MKIKSKDKTSNCGRVTVDHVSAIALLREGGVESYFSLAEATGLSVNQIDSILSRVQELPVTIKCRQCGTGIKSIPCLACVMAKRTPLYVVTKSDRDTLEDERSMLLGRLRARGINDTRTLARLTGMTLDAVDEAKLLPVDSCLERQLSEVA